MPMKVVMYHGWQVAEVAHHAKNKGCTMVLATKVGVCEVWHPDTGELIFSAQKSSDHCGMWHCRYDARCFREHKTGALVKYQSSLMLPWDKRVRCAKCNTIMTRYVNGDLKLYYEDCQTMVELVGFACDHCNTRCYYERNQMGG